MIKTRSLIEGAAEREPKVGDMELLSEAYGEYYFKCPVFTCTHFQQGFPSRANREAHVKVHKLEYKCPHENCAFHITGFRSESGLESHLSWFHEATQLPYMFPHLEPKSAWQSFEEAIDHDDVGLVRNFCLDSLDVSNPPKLLLRAVKKGSFKSARVLAEYPELSKELYERDMARERSPLCLAAEKGESELTGFFLSLVTDEQIPRAFWRGTFLKLIKDRHSNVLRTILDNGRDLSKHWKYSWENPLTKSFATLANFEDEQTTALLFRYIQQCNASRKHIERAAAAVAKKGDRALVRRLFEFQENDDFPGNTKFTKSLGELKSAGIDAMVERIMERAGGVVGSKGKTWGNALQKAALDGNDEKIRMLVGSGAGINHAGSRVGTALQAAARKGHESTVRLLLGRGANPSLSTSKYFGNPLAEAAAKGNCKIISILLEAGLNPSMCQDRLRDHVDNATPLHFAARNAHIDAITLLLENGASTSSLDSKGNSALHYLAEGATYWRKKQPKKTKQHEDALASIEILVAHGADVTVKNSGGNTPLHELWNQVTYGWMIKEHRVDYLLELSASFIRNGADLNAKNKDGREIRDIGESSYSQDVREAVKKLSSLGASEQI